jgi:hypothetical protein
MQESQSTTAVDQLIKVYQDKLDALRNKEDYVKKICKDSRSLLKDKRIREAEMTAVKQEMKKCSEEIDRLNAKLHELTTKDEGLTHEEAEGNKELKANADDIVSNLYEIMLRQSARSVEAVAREDMQRAEAAEKPAPEAKAEEEEEKVAVEEVEEKAGAEDGEKVDTAEEAEDVEQAEDVQQAEAEEQEEEDKPDDTRDIDIQKIKAMADEGDETEEIKTIEPRETASPPALPKSVVKTKRGTVIAEYYYDPSVYKNKRHYIYNGHYFQEKLAASMRSLRKHFDQNRFGEALQMVQDTFTRIDDNENLHYEDSINAIFNTETLKEVHSSLKARHYKDVLDTCDKIGAAITALGDNYYTMLSEQMKRLSKSK